MEVITDFPERLQPGVVVYIGEQFVPHTIRSCRAHGTALLLLGFTACQTPEEAGMPLMRPPKPFSLHTSRHLMRLLGNSDDQWRKYLFY